MPANSNHRRIINKGATFVKVGLVYTLSNMILRGMAFITTPLFTRMMTKSDYGEFSGIASWANILSIIVTFNFASSINRAKYDFNDEIYKYMSSILLMGSGITTLAWIIIEINMTLFTKLFAMPPLYIRSIMTYALMSPASHILLTKYKMYNEYKKVVVMTWITVITTTVSSLALVFFLENKLNGRVFGSYLVPSIVFFVYWIFIIIRGKSFRINYCKYALFLCVPLIPHELAGILLSSSDRIIINQLCGGSDAALYSIAYTISIILSVFLSSLNQAWIPWFYDHLNKKDSQSIAKVSTIYMLVFAAGCVFLMFIAPELVLILGGKSYLEAVQVIPPVCLAVMLQFVYTLYVNIEFYVKKTFMISVATILATCTNIGLNYLFIPIFGYVAAAYTTVAGYLLMFIFHKIIVSRGKYCDAVFDSRLQIFTLTIVGVMSMAMLTLYFHTYIRYALLGIYIIGLIHYTKNNWTLVKIFVKK